MTAREMYDELMERCEKLFDNHFQYLRKEDYKFFEPLQRNGYHPDYVHIWGGVEISFDIDKQVLYKEWFYKVNLKWYEPSDKDQLIYDCVSAWLDNREKELAEREETPSVEELMPKLLECAQNAVKGTNYTAEIQHGKRQCDTNTSGYNAIVILYKGHYDRLFRLFRNRFGEYKMMTAAPLCGECTWSVSLDNMFSELENEIKEKCR